jgi:DNA-binding protein H-NS
MTIDLSTMTRPELEQLRRRIDQALDRLAKKERKLALEAAEQAARAHGFSLSDLTGAQPRGAAKPKAPSKYKNPADPSQTWSGRGRQPGWIKEGLAKGKSLSDFEI